MIRRMGCFICIAHSILQHLHQRSMNIPCRGGLPQKNILQDLFKKCSTLDMAIFGSAPFGPPKQKTLAVSKFVKPRLEPKSIPGMPGMPGKLPQDVPTDCFLQVLPGSLTNLAPAKFNITKGHKSLPTITSCG